MTSGFQELIQKTQLTKKERLIADYVLSHFRDICFMTSTELAEAVELSHSSVMRFTKDLGFSGYTEFQKNVREQYDEYIKTHHESSTIPTVKLNQSLEKLSHDNIPQTLEDIANQNIKSVILRNSHETFEKASDAIINSQNKYIISSRGCSSVASFLSVILKNSLPMVFAEPSFSQNTFDFLSDINENDCVIIASLPRYSKLLYLAAEMAHSKGATVVVFTNTPTAPIAKYADHLFIVPVDSLTFFNSQVPALFAAELLSTYISKKIGCASESKLQLIDQYTSKMELY